MPVIDEMSWEEVGELKAYWLKVPPLATVVRAFVGWEPPKKKAAQKASTPSTKEELQQLADMMNAFGK